MAGPDRSYTQDEVNAILRRALATREDFADGVTHQELIETAREVGIAPHAIEQAIAEEKRERDRLVLVGEIQRGRRSRFTGHLVTFAFVNALCFAIDFLTPGQSWFYWVLVPWGMVLLLSALRLTRPPGVREVERLERRRQREQHRIERRRRNEALHGAITRSAGHIEKVVEEGASLLLAHLQDRSRRIAPRSRNLDEKSRPLPRPTADPQGNKPR